MRQYSQCMEVMITVAAAFFLFEILCPAKDCAQ